MKIVLEPVFEADMLPCSFGFRPRPSARDALLVPAGGGFHAGVLLGSPGLTPPFR